MAKKPVMKRITEFFEGDREPGETAPADDSHIKVGDIEPIVGEMLDPAPVTKPVDDEETYQVEIAGIVREVDKATYDLVMEERATRVDPEPAPEPLPEPEPEPEFDEVEFYTDPGLALKKVKEEAIQEATDKLSRQHAVDKAQNDFWAAFYKENPALADEEMLVKITLAKNMKDLRNLSDGKTGRDKLAELVEGEILRITNKQRGHKPPDDTTRLEGETSPATEPTPVSSDAESTSQGRPPSVGDALKQRKLKRDRARRGEQTQLS